MRVRDVARIISGQAPPSNEVTHLSGGLPFLQGNAEFGAEFPTARFQCDDAPKRAAKGDVLLSVRAPVGAVNKSDSNYGIGRGLCAVRAASVESTYLYWLLVCSQPRLESLATGSTFSAVTSADVANLAVPIIEWDRQVQIAAFLDRETSEIDAFLADQHALITLLDERRRAEIDSAVLGGRTRLVEVRRLGARMQSGTSVNGESIPAGPGDVGVLRTGAASKGYLDLNENKRVVVEDVSRVSCPLRVGTLLVNRANTADLVGSAVFVDRSRPHLYLSDKLWQVEFKDATAEFMAWWAKTTDYRQQVKLRCVGSSSSMQNLAYESYLNLEVPLYALERQRQIVEVAEAEVAELSSAIVDAREAIALSKERRAALITAAVTGQINVTEKKRVLV